MSQANIKPTFALAITNALKKGIDAQTARDETAPGVYRDIKVSVEIEVDEMRVAPDTDKSPTASIPLLTTCALLLQRFPSADRERALDIFGEVMKQAMDMSSDAQKKLLAESGVAELEKRIREEIIAKLPRTPVKGAVTIKPEDVRVVVTEMSMQRS